MNLQSLQENLAKRQLAFSYFSHSQEALHYLQQEIQGCSVGMGGSLTLKELGLFPLLQKKNQVIWHWEGGHLSQAAQASVYLSSVNALAETGEIVNLDGRGNRVASLSFGHSRVYLIAGINKLVPDLPQAIQRAREVAAPQRAKSLLCPLPCAQEPHVCCDCSSPQRICRVLSILLGKPSSISHMEVVLIAEHLGL